MQSSVTLGIGSAGEFSQARMAPLSLERPSAGMLSAAMLGAETPQTPLTVRSSSPPASTKMPMLQMMPQGQLQATAQQQIQAFQQAMVQAQAQSHMRSQMQHSSVPMLAKSQPSSVQLSQAQQQTPTAQATCAQMQQALAQQSMRARQRASQPSLLQLQQQVQPQQQLPQSDEAHTQMHRQLQEQVVAQVWAQTQVQLNQRESSSALGTAAQQAQAQQAQLTGRGQPTLVRQTSCARYAQVRSNASLASPPPSSPPVAFSQRSDIRRSSDVILQAEPVSARELQVLVAQQPDLADGELLPGIVVSIDHLRFEIMQPLGMGSYGMVWSALSESSNREVAVKEILCKSQGELQIAHFEGNLLYKLGHMETGACQNGRLPALVAQETKETSIGRAWRVRLAMSRIPGMPLMILLEQHREYKKAPETEPATNGSAPPPPELCGLTRPEAQLPGETLLDALLRKLWQPCLFTRELIVQIFPTLERIAAVAYHRDINPRNILVDSPDQNGPPNYGLVDFGMAVDAGLWRADAGGNWNTLEVGGDCRYWPVSAWVMFLHGPQELTPSSPWRLEYQTQLDIHALGITALQVFVDLLPHPQDYVSGDADEETGGQAVLLLKLKALSEAWKQYWEDAMDFWSCLIDCFTNNGDWNALKRACIHHGVQEAITRDLSDLRTTLADVADTCAAIAKASDRGTSQSSGAPKQSAESARELESVFVAMRSLISVGDSCQFPNWRTIHAILRLPASMEDLATAKVANGAASGKPGCMLNSGSANNLSPAPGRSYSSTATQSPIGRGVSVASDLPGPKSPPPAARRQASVVRNSTSGSSTHRMVSMVASGSPMCSPRSRTATVLVDSSGRQMSSHAGFREPISSRRSNTVASPAGPSRALVREASVTAEALMGHKSTSALAPAHPSFGRSSKELPPPWWSTDTARSVAGTPSTRSIIRATSAAAGPTSGVVREFSVAGLPEAKSWQGIRPVGLSNSSSPDFMSGLAGGAVTVLTKNSSAAPGDFGQSQVIRGSSVAVSNYKRPQSPVGRGSSVVIETTSGGAVRSQSVAFDTPLATARRTMDFRSASPSYVSDSIFSGQPGPSPSPGPRMVMQPPGTILSARQWAPKTFAQGAHGFTTSGSDGGTPSGGASLLIAARATGFGSDDSVGRVLLSPASKKLN